MAVFPSQEWIELFQKGINESEAYRNAAKRWEGTFIFVVEPDPKFKQEVGVFADLWHGSCRSVALMAPPFEKKADYIWKGRYTDWMKLLQGDLEAPQGIVSGKFRIDGNVMNLLSRGSPFAANELVVIARKVPTEFYP